LTNDSCESQYYLSEVFNLPTIHPICGEFGDHRWILEQLKKAIRDRKFTLRVIFPTLSLFHQIQDELLDEPGVNGLGGIRFLLFEGFIQELGERFGLEGSAPSPLMRDLLITEAFESLNRQDKLAYLGRAPFTAGYRQAVLAGIAEWKRSCLTPDLFTNWAAAKGEKQQQLALLYRTYQQLLVENGFREEDLILCQLERIRAEGGIGSVTERFPVILYGFSDLTPLQSKFLETLSTWFDFEIILDPTPVKEIRQFIARQFACHKLPEMPQIPDNNTLSQLQCCYGTVTRGFIPIRAEDKSVQILQTAGWSKQATAIACEIVKLLRDNPNEPLDNFLILSPEPQVFLKAAYPVFAEYHLALPAQNNPVGEYPGPQFFSQALTTGDSDWQWPAMEVLLRQQYNGESAAVGDRILVELGERYGALSGKERWLRLLRNQDFHRYFSEKGLLLEPLRQVIALLESIPETASLKVYLAITRRYFNKIRKALAENLVNSGIDLELQVGNLKAIQQLIATMDETAAYLDQFQSSDREISLSDFRNFWLNYVLNGEIKTKQPSGPAVKVLVPQEARAIKAKIVFITGLEQGTFPRNYVNDWKLSLQDRRELQALGVELETGQQYQTKEKLAFYWGLQTAEERLYLVYQIQDSSGQPLNPSSFLDEIQQCFPELWERAKCYPLALEPPSSLTECCSGSELGSFLATRLITGTTEITELERTNCRQLLENPSYQQLAMQIWQEYSWRMRFQNSLFDKPDSKELVAKIFGADHTFAITALEDYHSCPYRFFLKQLLKVKPLSRPQMLPDNLDLGNLYHHVLQEFAEPFKGQSFSPERSQEYYRFLKDCFGNFYREWQQEAANDLVKLVLSLQETQIWGILQRWLKTELDWAVESNGRFKIRFLEFGFGLIRGDFDPDSIAEPYQFEIAGASIKIWGKVDRIDVDDQGGFVVYDYKSGRGPSTKELLQVDYLQIPVYLLALEQLRFGAEKSVGGSYLGLKEPSRSRGGIWHTKRLRLDLNGKCLLGEAEWQDWLTAVKASLAASVSAIRNGEFSPANLECPSFCDYRSCCRRNEREVAAGDETSVERAAN
jgi:ATP-dependent helicase/nuclease subunit B